MALVKQLCCFGILVVLMSLGTPTSAQKKQQGLRTATLVRPRPTGQKVNKGQQVARDDRSNVSPPIVGQKTRPDIKTPPPIPQDLCNVDSHDRVPCGVPGTSSSECEALDCCYDGNSCYFKNTVTLHCTRDGQMIIVVSKEVTVPSLILESVNLLGGEGDSSCAPVDSNSVFAIYQFKVTACGTTMREEDGFIVYENQMTSSYEVGIGPLGSITRDTLYEVTCQCRYFGESVEALVVEVLDVEVPASVSLPGPLNVEIRLGSGVCTTKGCNEDLIAYTSYYVDSDYPLTKVLRDSVYVEVRMLERTDPNIVLILTRCWATTSPDCEATPQWDLLVDGCPYRDDRYQTTIMPVMGVDFPGHYKRFAFKMFTFVDPTSFTPMQESIYIHCRASVCKPSSVDSCQPRCGDISDQKQNRFRRATEKGISPDNTVSLGPITMKR